MRTMRDMMGGLGALGESAGTAAAASQGNSDAIQPNGKITGFPPGFEDDQVGTEPLGNLTGAPPWLTFRTYQVVPEAALAANSGPTLVVDAARASRLITFIAPSVGFTVYIGDAGVRANPGGSGLALPPGLPYQITIPGNQTVHAITDSPAYLQLRVQIGPLLGGDRERVY